MKRVVALLLLLCLLVPLSACAGDTKAPIDPDAGPEAYNRKDVVIGLPTGAAAMNAAEEQFPDATFKYFATDVDGYTAVASGDIDAFAQDFMLLQYACEENAQIRMVNGSFAQTDISVGISKQSAALKAPIDAFIEELISSGMRDDMLRRWLLDADNAMPELEKPVSPDRTIRVGTSGIVTPMTYYGDNGALTGYDIELLERMALALNAGLEISVMNYPALVAGLEAGTIDIAVANLNITPERAERIDFSIAYMTSASGLVVRADTAAAGVTLDSLAGKRIGVTTGSLCDRYALEQWADAEVMYYDGAPALTTALQQGKVDAFLVDEPLGRQITKNTAGLETVREPVTVDMYGFAFQKNDVGGRLRDEFDEFLKEVLDSGLMDELDALWFGDDEDKKVLDAADTLPATNGTVRFASTMEAAPFNYISDEQPMGLEIDLITRFCRERGYGLEIDTVTFGALLPGLVSDYYDAVASSITITEERAESVSFSEPFYTGGVVAVVKSAADESAALTDPAVARIGSMTGTICEELAVEHYPDAEYSSFNAVGDMMAALKSGRLDYGSMPEIDAINYLRADPGYRIAPGELALLTNCIAVAKGNDALVEQMDSLLDKYEADGTLKRLEENWLRPDGSDYVIDEVPRHEEGPELRLAFCSGLEPSCFMMDGEVVGMDIELAYRLAYDLGYRLTLSDMSFSALIAAVESGRADMAISGIAATEERAQKVDFTRSYCDKPVVLVYYQDTEPAAGGFFTSLADSFRRNFITEGRWKLIASGMGVTLLLSVCSGIAGLLIGFGLCLMRMSRWRAPGGIAIVLTRILQGTPMVVLLMILYYIVLKKTGLDGIAVSIIAFGLNFGAYASEIMLSGIRAVETGQREAAAAIGFTPVQTFTGIVFPQAARHFLPVLKGEYISLVKMTSIVGYVAVQDLTKVSDIIRSRTYEAFFPLICTAILYFLLSFGLSSLLKLVEIRIDPTHRPRTLKGVKLR